MGKIYAATALRKLMLLALFSSMIWSAKAQTYCTTNLYSTGCTDGDAIASFSTTGGSTNITNNNNGCGTLGYTFFNTQTHTGVQGTTVNYSFTNNPDFGQGYKIWVDWNQDGTFAAAEMVYASAAVVPFSTTVTGNFTIPVTATPGMTRLRIRCVYNTTTFDACTNHTWGETEDYNLMVVAATACTGTPTAGTAASTSTNICPNTNFTLSLNGSTLAGGLNYQWQSSPNNTTWTNITGATTINYSTTQTASTYYRAIVTCTNGNASDTSTVIQVISPTLFAAGTYTINGALPTGGTNFQTFGDAVAAMSCGIGGPVLFNVAPGTYNEQVTIPQINGASATNTIVFKGNLATLSFSSTNTNNRGGIWLNGADHITIDSLNINVSAGTYGWGVLLSNQADSNKILNCIINTSTTSTSSNFIGIYINGSPSSTFTSGNNGNGNLIQGNTVNGGLYGIKLYGSTFPYNVNNKVINNTITNFYNYGVYIYGNNDAIISGNDISRPTRTSVSTTYGVYTSSGSGLLVEKNRVHNVYDALTTATTSSTYGFYFVADGNTANRNKAYNNAVYNITKTNGTVYGIYFNFYYYWNIYHNTIVLNDAAATAGSTYGISGYGTSDSVRNNIVYITRGGTGTKYLLYYASSGASIPYSNNNVLYLNAPAGTNNFGYTNSVAYPTFAGWQGANGGTLDQQSVNVDPQFANPLTGNLYPNNTAISIVGAPLGVTTDIINFPRSSSNPTPGAYEIVPSTGTDMGASALVSPVQKSCYNSTETVSVNIKNYSANTHNFAAVPVTVNVSVTGPNATTFTPVVVNTGTLASGATLNVVISNAYNMTAAGTYTFSASTTATGDANANNDAMPAVVINDTALAAGTLSSNPPSYCVTGGIPTLTLSGGGGGSIQWQESTTGAAGSWTNIGNGSITYTPAAAISATRYFRVYRTCNANGDTSAVLTVAVNNPQLLTTVPGTRCGPGTVNLSATGSAGSTFNWYTAATGGTPIYTGATFTTPILNNTTTYYVAASSGGLTGNVGKASYNSTNGTNTAGAYLIFDALTTFTLNSVVIHPGGSGPGTVTIGLRNSAGTLLQTATVNATGSSTAVPQTVALGWSIPAGSNYRLVYESSTGGVTSMYREYTSIPFPYTLPGIVSITNGSLSGYYYYFYNWTVSTGCESARQAVTATVTPSPSFDVTNDLTVCNNSITQLQVNSTVTDFNSYTWSPASGLFTNAAATTPYTTGSSASSVYVQQSVPGTYTYIATANNTTSGCQNYDSVKVTVLPATLTVTPTPDELCVSGTASLSISPNPTSFGNATFQWLRSTDNINYTAIAGATANTYTTPTINTTTYYKVEVKNSAGSVCLSAYDTVKVNSPQILTTTPAALCGPGVMTLNATATAGTTINWYTAPVGGTLAGTGTTFTTPNLTTTTTYYAAALQGGGGATTGVTLPQLAATICGIPTTSATTGWALRFTTTRSVVINSVYVIPTAPGTVTIELRAFPSTGVLASVVSQSFTSGDVGTPQQVNLGMTVSSPGNYQLVMASGGSNRITTMGCAYPMSTPSGGFSITGSATSATATANTTTYNSFFHINVTEGCESPRVAVVAQVSPNTAITTQPSNISTCVGSTVHLTVGAVGANLNYQWKKNGANIGSNNDTLTLTPVALTDAGTYTVEITGLCGNVTSQTVTVNVSAANTWVGAVSTDWNTAANWCGGIPTSTSDVAIFPGTPYQPIINATMGSVRNITISNGASLTINPNGTLNIYGDLVNNGAFTAPGGFVFFKGANNQNVSAMTAGTVLVNGTGGVTLTGGMTVTQTLILVNGNITLGVNNLTITGSVDGTLASHIVTNSSGSVVTRNVTTTEVKVPVGPSATSYNPIYINNGNGRDYAVRVATGLTPAVANPGLAVNRTWNITPSGAATGVNITFQYDDTHMNTPGVATNSMEVGAHNGTAWSVVSPASGVTPSGTPTGRQVGVTTSQFGPMVVGNIGTLSWITSVPPSVDPTVSKMVLMPNLIESSTVLRVISTRASRITWNVVDQSGRVVMTFSRQVMIGQTDISLEMSRLAAGVYNLAGFTDKGKTQVLRFVKM